MIKNMPSPKILINGMKLWIPNKKTMIEIKETQVPPGKQVNKYTWAFCRKRRPNKEIYKLKERLL
jgi:hypothetical protein